MLGSSGGRFVSLTESPGGRFVSLTGAGGDWIQRVPGRKSSTCFFGPGAHPKRPGGDAFVHADPRPIDQKKP
ncbi:MAG: hypothetical protein ABW133_13600, partial [Polyangiaceae bacterium]